MVKDILLCVEDVHKMLHFLTSLHPREENIAAVGEHHCVTYLYSQRSTEFSSPPLSHKGKVVIQLCIARPYIAKLKQLIEEVPQQNNSLTEVR